jgi:hypothetical protein
MKMVAVTTMRDAGGAEVAKEMLAEHGITVEVRRLSGYNPYFGSPSNEEYEVRVPEGDVDGARALIAGMADELERAALAEAGVPPGEDDARGGDDLPPPELRPRKPSWAVALGLVGPLPGCGLLYARSFALGWIFVGIALGIIVTAIAVGNEHAFAMYGVLKLADVVAAPFAAARFNRKLEEHHAASA